MKEMALGAIPRLTVEVEGGDHDERGNGNESWENVQSHPPTHAVNGVQNVVPATPKVPSTSRGRDWPIGDKAADLLGLNEKVDEESEETVEEKYALDNAPPPIKTRREGESSEEPCPSPPPSPKRMREVSRKDAIHSLPFSKVFSQGSI